MMVQIITGLEDRLAAVRYLWRFKLVMLMWRLHVCSPAPTRTHGAWAPPPKLLGDHEPQCSTSVPIRRYALGSCWRIGHGALETVP